MKRSLVLVLGAALVAAACTYQAPTYRDLDRIAQQQQREAILNRPPPDTCQLAAHRHLLGADGGAIQQSSLPAGARIICHGCAVTLDYRAERLNLELGPDGKVANLRCG
ncbi:MAG TPA: I78 family peptidase inhibitor [Vitreimonas sp.]|uniref:I78 family peptidase inhibitor n=1 Tax=Vitreimonas sp. TaxID=3069702 RepID=UPI002D41E471|nr:I78 family peptidase inhibitor [Vitreimonas sp.]HYD85953.1 I78 family peptidase inhibitor [Vitreimonas sp.]